MSSRSLRVAAPRTPEERDATRVFLVSLAIVGALFSLYTSMQSTLVFGVVSAALRDQPPAPLRELLTRSTVNLLSVAVLIGLVALFAPQRRRAPAKWLWIVGLAFVSGVFRAACQEFAGIFDITIESSRNGLLVEIGTTTLVGVSIVSAGVVQEAMWRRVSASNRTRLEAERHVSRLLRELQDEELRIRQDVSQTLHGSVQTEFVVLEARLATISTTATPELAAEVRAIAAQLARLREGEIRALAAELYPADLERGTRAAVASVLARIPHTVSVHAHLDDLAHLDDSATEASIRVLAVRVIEEGVSNALRHGNAGTIAVEVHARDRRLSIAVINTGPPPSPDQAAGTGLTRLAQYLRLADGTVHLETGDEPGTTRLRAELTF